MTMLSRTSRTAALASATALLIAVAATAARAEPAQDPPRPGVAGTWALVSEIARKGSTTTEPLGPHPLGSMMLDRGGRFMLMIARPGLPRFAANRREAGTPEENRAVLGGSLSFFGTYTVADGALILRVEASTFPNWVGTEQKRFFTLNGDEMRWTNRAPAIAAEVAELVWKRIP